MKWCASCLHNQWDNGALGHSFSIKVETTLLESNFSSLQNSSKCKHFKHTKNNSSGGHLHIFHDSLSTSFLSFLLIFCKLFFTPFFCRLFETTSHQNAVYIYFKLKENKKHKTWKKPNGSKIENIKLKQR